MSSARACTLFYSKKKSVRHARGGLSHGDLSYARSMWHLYYRALTEFNDQNCVIMTTDSANTCFVMHIISDKVSEERYISRRIRGRPCVCNSHND